MRQYISSVERKTTTTTKQVYIHKLSFKNEGEIKISPDKPKPREFATSRPTL